ncbi:MAG: hypothetical protein R3F22_02545 [Lysobacteraceae bacterium]
MNLDFRTQLVIGLLLLVVALALPRFLSVSDTAQGVLYGLAIGTLFSALIRRQRGGECDEVPKALGRRYMRELIPAMVAYMVTLFLSVWLLKQVELEWLRALLALLPVAPVVLVMRAIIRYIRDTDELQQKIELEAVSIATALVSLLYMSGGFLQSAKVIDVPSAAAMIWVFPLVCATYGLAKLVVSSRYR